MTVIPFPDRRPWRLRCLIFELCVELEEARREFCRARGLPPGRHLHLVPATSPHPDR